MLVVLAWVPRFLTPGDESRRSLRLQAGTAWVPADGAATPIRGLLRASFKLGAARLDSSVTVTVTVSTRRRRPGGPTPGRRIAGFAPAGHRPITGVAAT
eukprot:759408-Hanusia_phi.AAC.1